MKKLIFDFDGTLVDSMKQWAGKMISVLEQNNISYPDNIIKIITPLGDKGAALYFINELGLNMSVYDIIAQMDEYAIDEYTHKILIKKDVDNVLIELKNKGYSLNILTASPHKMLDVCLKRNSIYDLFDNVWSCDDFATTKSDVNIYHFIAEKLETSVENCVFFDDNLNALQTAKRSGMYVVGVYDESSAEYEAEIKEISHRYIYIFDDIIKMESEEFCDEIIN